MRITRKTDYALRSLFTLVEHRGRGPIPVRELARRNDVPKRFLEHILLQLKSRGWVDSVPGKRGGYRLVKDPVKITMGQVIRLFDGDIAPLACVSPMSYRKCSQEPVCRFRRFFLDLRNSTAEWLDHTTLAAVHAGGPVRKEEVFGERWMDGEGI